MARAKGRFRPRTDPALEAEAELRGRRSSEKPSRREMLKRSSGGGGETLQTARRRGPLGFFQVLGPGLITGASDDDPSGIGTYSQVGSQYGFGMLWTALFTFPLMAGVQELCARIALQTGHGLATALKRKFPAWLVAICVVALFAANTINVGADLAAIAAGAQLLGIHVHAIVLVIVAAAVILTLQVITTYTVIQRVFKYLTLALFAYVITVVVVRPHLGTVLAATFVPHLELSGTFLTGLVAVLGTTISPYLFFWQASSEVDEQKAHGRNGGAVGSRQIRAARIDIIVGMAFSQIVMYCIILTSGAALHTHGASGVQSAAEAAAALQPLAGHFATVIFAVGLIGTGFLAIPILSGSAAYGLKEVLGIRGNYAVRFRWAPTFYTVILLSTLLGVGMNLLHIDPIRALVITAVINGIVAPPLLVLITLLGSDRGVMRRQVSGRLSRVICWVTVALMSAAVLVLALATWGPLSS